LLKKIPQMQKLSVVFGSVCRVYLYCCSTGWYWLLQLLCLIGDEMLSLFNIRYDSIQFDTTWILVATYRV